MSNEHNNLYEFGEFRLDTKERVLFRENETIILAPKVFDTLETLIKSNGKIVSKDGLMDEIWADSFVEEGNLTQNIYVLRQTLGKEFIETIPRRGYRFAVDVETIKLENDLANFRTNGNPAFQNGENSPEIVVATKTKTFLKEELIEEDTENLLPKTNQQTKFIEANLNTTQVVRSSKFHFGLAIGIFAAVLVGAFGLFVWQRNNISEPVAPVINVSFTNLTESGDVRNMAISPDGQFLAVVKREGGNGGSIWIKDITSKQELPLDLSKDFTPQVANFSSDGNSIFFLNRRSLAKGAEIYKTTRFGGSAEFIGGNVWSEFAISSDGEKIAFYRHLSEKNQFQLVVKNLTDQSEKILVKKDFPDSFLMRSSPAFSPDGKEIYAIIRPEKQALSKIVSIDTESGKERIIKTPNIRQFVSVVALPNGEDLLFTARERRKYPQVYRMNKAGGKFQRLTNDLNVYRQISLSKDGKNLAVLQKHTYSHIWFIPESSPEKAVQLTFGKTNRDGRQGLDILPDGKIVFTSLEDLNRDLWTINPKDGSKQQLTKQRGDINDRPFVPQTGNYIYFNSDDNEKTFNIERIGINTQNIEKVTGGKSQNDMFPTVSPDGTTLYFIRREKGKSSLYKKILPDGEETEVKLPEGFSADSFPTISPDGRFLAMRQADKQKLFDIEEEVSNTIKIAIIPIDESDSANAKMLEITTSQSQFRWNATSNAIYFVKHTDKDTAIWKQDVFAETKSQKILEIPDMRIYHFQYTNEMDFAVSMGKHVDDVILIKNFN